MMRGSGEDKNENSKYVETYAAINWKFNSSLADEL